MTAPVDDKYVVVKRSEIDQLLYYFRQNPNLCDGINAVVEKALGDAVVIRRQDHFAPAALHVYSQSIAVAITAIYAAENGHNLTSDQLLKVKHLRTSADYFHEQAVAAEAEAFKLPD